MIGKLRGKIDMIRDRYAIIDVGGVGYRVLMTEVGLGRIATKEEAAIFVHTHVREDQLVLFGFETLEELEMFELLISVSGVGPKAALAILTIATPAMVKMAVTKEDPSLLTRVSGVGKKTAQRVILELKNKVERIAVTGETEAQHGQEVVEALMAMGYNAFEARESLKAVPKEVTDESERIRAALRAMKK